MIHAPLAPFVNLPLTHSLIHTAQLPRSRLNMTLPKTEKSAYDVVVLGAGGEC